MGNLNNDYEVFSFKSGELIPEWIEKTDNGNYIITFGKDVSIYKFNNELYVVPSSEIKDGEYIIHIKLKDSNLTTIMTGHPTVVWHTPITNAEELFERREMFYEVTKDKLDFLFEEQKRDSLQYGEGWFEKAIPELQSQLRAMEI